LRPCRQMKRIDIGRLAEFDVAPGFYAYVGSAFGGGGLCARIGHHLESTASPYWHIDYLLQVAQPVEVWPLPAKNSSTTGPTSLRRHRNVAYLFPISARRITTAAVQVTCFTPSDALPLDGFENSLSNALTMCTQNATCW